MKHLMVLNHFITVNPQTNPIWIKIKQIEQKKRVVTTGDSMMNGIQEKGMYKNHRVKINNFSGGTSAMILKNIGQLVKSESDCLIVHERANDLANGTQSFPYWGGDGESPPH